MKSQTASRSYARALFDLARERGQLDAIGTELADAVQAVGAEPALKDFFARPGVAATAKRAAATEIAQRLGASALLRDFLGLVAAQGRGDELAAIGAAFRELEDNEAGRARARVRTARPLDDGERAALAQRLSAAVGKTILVEEAVDPNLLGGFVAEIGSLVVDGSLDGQLARMRERLARG